MAWTLSRSWGLLSLAGIFSLSYMVQPTAYAASPEPSHKASKSIFPKREGKKLPFHTFSMSPQHELWLCCSSSSSSSGDQSASGAILVYSVEGELLRSIDLDFIPQSLGFAPDGTRAFVSGSGSIASLDMQGKQVHKIEAPNVGNKEEAIAAMRAEAEEQSAAIRNSMQDQVDRVQKQIDKLEKAPEEETETQEKRRMRRLKILKQQAAQFESMMSQSTIAVVEESSLSRLMRTTGLAVGDQDVFVALPTSKGYGYDVWRLNHDLAEAKIVLERGSGCCGQYDIQCDGTNLVVAENGSFRVAIYDRDGKELSHFGKRDRNDSEGFGSCCNPMNVRCCENGDVLTAESSIGHIKRFNSAGEFVGFVGTAPIGGGCKHVAIAHDESSDKYFMFNQDRSCISVLVPKDQIQGETEEEKASREAMAGLGKKLIGTWVLDKSAKPASDSAPDASGLGDYFATSMGTLAFMADGKLKKGDLQSDESTDREAAKKQLAQQVGSEESAEMLMANQSNASWQAVSATEDKLTIAFLEDKVRSFDASITFQDETMTVNMFMGSEEQTLGAPMVYRLKSNE
jgi:hypothetical protein